MKAVGIILAGGNGRRMKELAERRAVAAMPMAGSFRAIDFALTSMSASSIARVAVITQYSARSLNLHLSSSKWWNFGRKQGGLFVFNPTVTSQNNSWYRGTADALVQNLDFLRSCHEPYVVIAGGDGIYKIDFNEVLDYHIEKGSDITIVCKRLPRGSDVSRFGVVETDEENRIVGFEEKPVDSTNNLVSCGIYVIRRRLLITLLEQCEEMEWFDFVSDVLMRQRRVMGLYAFIHEKYWANIATVNSYYECNMDFLCPEIQQEFFEESPHLMTKEDDCPPAKFNDGACVENSLIASGTIINSRVENSVVFRRAVIGNGCTVKDSILLPSCRVEDGAQLDHVIVEAQVVIPSGTRISGSADDPVIITLKDGRRLG